jgi:hypothetical protein
MTGYEQLRDEFVRAIEDEARIPLTDSSRKNRAASDVRNQRDRLCSTREGREALTELLTHSSTAVRLRAAVGALSWDPARARAVISAIRDSDDRLLAFDAEMILEELEDPSSPLSMGVAARSVLNPQTPPPARPPALAPDEHDALNLLQTFHGYVLSGGLAHALEVDYQVASRAAAILRRLEFSEPVAVLHEALEIAARGLDRSEGFDVTRLTTSDGNHLEELGTRYEQLVPDDDELERRLAG